MDAGPFTCRLHVAEAVTEAQDRRGKVDNSNP